MLVALSGQLHAIRFFPSGKTPGTLLAARGPRTEGGNHGANNLANCRVWNSGRLTQCVAGTRAYSGHGASRSPGAGRAIRGLRPGITRVRLAARVPRVDA